MQNPFSPNHAAIGYVDASGVAHVTILGGDDVSNPGTRRAKVFFYLSVRGCILAAAGCPTGLWEGPECPRTRLTEVGWGCSRLSEVRSGWHVLHSNSLSQLELSNQPGRHLSLAKIGKGRVRARSDHRESRPLEIAVEDGEGLFRTTNPSQQADTPSGEQAHGHLYEWTAWDRFPS